MKIEGENIYLRLLSPNDVTEDYLNWMQDEKIIEFLESRWRIYSLDDLKNYVKTVNESSSSYMFGIFLKENNLHVGNIKIGNMDQIHRYADVGLIIGNRTAWGKGYGSEAIKLVTNYAFNQLNLNKIFAGIYSKNIGSYKAFLKAGYREVGKLEKHRYCDGEYIDEYLVEMVRPVINKE